MRTVAEHHEYRSGSSKVVLSSDRTFGLVLGTFFALVAVLPLLHQKPFRWWAFGTSLLFFASGLLIPKALHPLNRLWAALARLLHRVVSPVAMALVFFLAFTSMGLVLRAFGKDLLRLRSEPDSDSYWIPRSTPGPAPETMVNQF